MTSLQAGALYFVWCVSLVSSSIPTEQQQQHDELLDTFMASDWWRIIRRATRDVPRSPVMSPESVGCQLITEQCRTRRPRPICASDGLTYASKCDLKRIELCQNRQLTVVNKGFCPTVRSRCLQEHYSAIRENVDSRQSSQLYVPECQQDGSYVNTQCHNATGYCWCVTSDGKPIPGSSVQGRLPDCRNTISTTRGLQTQYKPLNSVGKRRRGVMSSGVCSTGDKMTFNNNLVRLFIEEYQRQPQHLQQQQQQQQQPTTNNHLTTSAGDVTRSRGVDWKFTSLDVDVDGQLDRKELKTLRQLVNKLVKPRPCARTFHSRCDVNNDKCLSRLEWTNCFSNNTTTTTTTTVTDVAQMAPASASLSSRQKNAPTNHRLRPPRRQFLPSQLRPAGRSGGEAGARRPTNQAKKTGTGKQTQVEQQSTLLALINSKGIRGSNRTGGGHFLQLTEQTQRDHRSQTLQLTAATSAHVDTLPGVTSRSSCEEERSRATEMDRVDPEGHIFIPDCEAGGVLYRKAQCHNATGYCWCVDQHTGFPIPGISTHNVTPDCTGVNAKRLKGCPPTSKKRFLTELLDNMTQEMVERANNGTVQSRLSEPNPEHSIEERAVRWKLQVLDTNNNKVLERRELKSFRADLRALRGNENYARKCRRNFLKYCDDNNDKRITLEEWINCTGLNDQPNNLPETHKRRGPNPFSTVLKS